MPMLGTAAMLLWYDIVAEEVAQHDEWHTREHFPERVGIPGFLRAQRWVGGASGPRYFVVYEVSDIGILQSGPYMDRLNEPTPWTRRMMPHFRGMTRGFCALEARRGSVLGTAAMTLRFRAEPGREAPLAARIEQWMATLVERPGLCSAILLKSASAPPMTEEQRIRGQDAAVDQVLMVTGYDAEAIRDLSSTLLTPRALADAGAREGALVDLYSLACQAQRSDTSE